MDEVFVRILNMSIAASWLILAVLLLRLVLKRAPKWTIVLLWGIAAVRLAVPFSLESAWSLVPSAGTFSTHNIQFETPAVSTGIPAVNNAVNPVPGGMLAPGPGVSVSPLCVRMSAASVVWLAGIAAMLLYAAFSYVRVYRSVAERVPYARNVFLCDHVRSPFILGLLAPKIYLPSDLETSALGPVIAHEKAHLARRDHWWKPLGFLILTVHWFNPLCWVAYVLLCRDIEQACDEKVIRQLDLDGKKQYSAALLQCSTGRRLVLVTICPLAFGEIGVKERVQNVLHYKKPAFWIVSAAMIACVAAAVCFLTDPVTAESGAPDGDDAAGGQRLTLDGVMTLSQKGDALTWSDFEQYAGQEIGSGLYIMRYGIDAQFEVRVGGMPEVTPMYVYLMAGSEAPDRIDIRTDDVAAFIAAHGAAVPEAAASGAVASGTAAPGNVASGTAAPGNAASGTVALGASASGASAPGAAASNPVGGEPTMWEPPAQEPAAGEFDLSALSDPLAAFYAEQEAARRAILEHNRPADPDGVVSGASFACLMTETTTGAPPEGKQITLYGWAMYEAYRVTDSGLKTVSSRHGPVALSFVLKTDGYMLTEYWEPREGKDYAEDLLEKFPMTINVANGLQNYAFRQRQECYAQAAAAAMLDTDPVIASLLETVCGSPALSSDAEEHIEEHADAYRELTYYGQYTLLYCFARFERGGETELEGKIMMRLCEDITTADSTGPLVYFPPEAGEVTGRMWYEAHKMNVLDVFGKYTKEEIERQFVPAYPVLLRMLGKF